MNVSHVAILLYGALTLILAAALAIVSGSHAALVLAVCAASATYLFQVLDALSGTINVPLSASYTLWAFAILLTVASVAVSVFSGV